MTSSPHGPYAPGYTRATMAGTMGCNAARWSQSQKASLSSDCSLQLDCMKSESLVIADQQAAVNTFPGLVHTARQPRKLAVPEVPYPTVRRGGPKVRLAIGVKS